MKRFLLPVILFISLLFVHVNAAAQWGRMHRGHPGHRSRTMVSIGLGGFLGGFFGSGFYGYGWGPGVGVNIGVVLPPPGMRSGERMNRADNAARLNISGITYYKRGDVYYRETQDGDFEAVPAPMGAAVTRLPMGARLQKIDGKYYYEKNGTYYYKDIDTEGRLQYFIVGKNGELNTQNNDRYNSSDENDYIQPNDKAVQKSENTYSEPTNNRSNTYSVRPQVGDRFDQLPRNSKPTVLSGKNVFLSPNNVYYKEVNEEGRIVYEVVNVK